LGRSKRAWTSNKCPPSSRVALRSAPISTPSCAKRGVAIARTAGEIQKALDDLGGIGKILPSADPAQRRLYASLGVRLEYNHKQKRVQATAETACVLGRVRRGVESQHIGNRCLKT